VGVEREQESELLLEGLAEEVAVENVDRRDDSE